MSLLLEQYEQQYATLIAEVISQLQQFNNNNNIDKKERSELSAKIDCSLSEAGDLLEQIGLEIRDLNISQRPSYSAKLNCAQVELKRLQKEYNTAKYAHTLAGSTTIDYDATGDADYYEDVNVANDQRQRLLENSERIERTGNRLNEGYRIAIETEELGARVLNDLHHQRETLQGSRARLRETNAELGRASRTLNTMMLRALREKAVLYVVGLCFVIAVGVSLYLSFSSSAPSAS